jgi:hypothetical protein
VRAEVPRGGGEIRALALAIDFIGGATVGPADHPRRPPPLQQLDLSREHQGGGSVNPVRRVGQGGFRACGYCQDGFLEAALGPGIRGNTHVDLVSNGVLDFHTPYSSVWLNRRCPNGWVSTAGRT